MTQSTHQSNIAVAEKARPKFTAQDRIAFEAYADTRVFDDESDYYAAWRTWLASRDHYVKPAPAELVNQDKSEPANTDALWETLLKVGLHLNIDFEAARSAPGAASDVYIAAIENSKAQAAKQAVKSAGFFARLKSMLG